MTQEDLWQQPAAPRRERGAYNREWHAEKQRQRDLAGLCRRCGKAERADGRTQCQPCIVKSSIENKRQKAARLARGQCSGCRNMRAAGRVFCVSCAERMRLKNHEARTASLENRVRNLIRAAKARSKKNELPFGLTVEDLGQLPTHCPVLGLELRFNGGRHGPDSPSLDRLRPELGYVRGNVRVISNRANELRRDASAAELEAVAAYARSLEPLTS